VPNQLSLLVEHVIRELSRRIEQASSDFSVISVPDLAQPDRLLKVQTGRDKMIVTGLYN